MKKKRDRIEELLREYFTSRQKPSGREEVEPAALRAGKAIEMHCEAPSLARKTSSTPSRKKKCPTLEDLAAFIEGVIDEKTGRFIKKHLAICPDCSRKYGTASDTIDRHRRGKSDRTPEDISEETSSRLDELYRRSRSPLENEDDM